MVFRDAYVVEARPDTFRRLTFGRKYSTVLYVPLTSSDGLRWLCHGTGGLDPIRGLWAAGLSLRVQCVHVL